MITPETTPPSIPTNSATAPAGETSATRTSSISLSNGNHPPVAHDDAATAVETGVAPGSDAIGNVLTNDTDVDGGDTKAVTTTGAHALTHGTLTLNADGSFDYAVNNADTVVDALRTATDTLTDTFSYTMTDLQGLTSSANLVITIQGANDAPIAQNDTLSTNEDTPINLAAAGVLANDTDVDTGDTKTVSAVNGVAGNVGAPVAGNFGTLTLFADGHLSFVPNAAAQALTAGTHATDVFTYTVHDTAGATSTASITITINGLNDAPVAHADGNVVAEDSVITATGNVLANDTDAESQSLTVSTVSGATDNGATFSIAGAHGTLVVTKASGAYTYTLNNADAAVQQLGIGATLTDTFHYTANDGNTDSNLADLVITINGTNDGPVAVADAASVTEDTTLIATGNVLTGGTPDFDTDTGDVLTVTGVTGNGTTNFATGHFTIATTFGTIDINAATGAYTYNLNNGAVQALGATQSTTDVFTYTISDGHGGISSADLTVTIHGTNDAPVANNNTGISVIEDTPTSINVLANDTDVDGPGPLAVTQINSTPVTPGSGIPVAVTGGTVTVNANSVLVFTPDANFNGPVSFTYVAKDVLGGDLERGHRVADGDGGRRCAGEHGADGGDGDRGHGVPVQRWQCDQRDRRRQQRDGDTVGRPRRAARQRRWRERRRQRHADDRVGDADRGECDPGRPELSGRPQLQRQRHPHHRHLGRHPVRHRHGGDHRQRGQRRAGRRSQWRNGWCRSHRRPGLHLRRGGYQCRPGDRVGDRCRERDQQDHVDVERGCGIARRLVGGTLLARGRGRVSHLDWIYRIGRRHQQPSDYLEHGRRNLSGHVRRYPEDRPVSRRRHDLRLQPGGPHGHRDGDRRPWSRLVAGADSHRFGGQRHRPQ